MTDDDSRDVEMRSPAPCVPDDGPALLDTLQRDLMMDDEWLIRRDRTLTWWGEPVPITFTVGEPRLVEGDPTVRLQAAVPVLTGVSVPTAEVVALLDQVNHAACCSAYVWLEDQRRIDAFVTTNHYDGVSPITQLFSAWALLAYTEAEARRGAFAEALNCGSAPVVEHPTSGSRTDYDDLLSFTEREVVPAGQEANRWEDDDLGEIADAVMQRAIGPSTGSPHGLTAEFPLMSPNPDMFSMPTALMQLGCEHHPSYGAGLAEVLKFPVRLGDEAAVVANALNLAEYEQTTDIPSLGAWCSDQDGLAHTAFVPNALYRPWAAQNLVWWEAARTRWAEQLRPDEL